jgi:hypothetical protein
MSGRIVLPRHSDASVAGCRAGLARTRAVSGSNATRTDIRQWDWRICRWGVHRQLCGVGGVHIDSYADIEASTCCDIDGRKCVRGLIQGARQDTVRAAIRRIRGGVDRRHAIHAAIDVDHGRSIRGNSVSEPSVNEQSVMGSSQIDVAAIKDRATLFALPLGRIGRPKDAEVVARASIVACANDLRNVRAAEAASSRKQRKRHQGEVSCEGPRIG